MDAKKPWQSKTNWVGLILAVAAFFPQAQVLIAGNPEMFAQAVGVIMIALRFLSKDKISIS